MDMCTSCIAITGRGITRRSTRLTSTNFRPRKASDIWCAKHGQRVTDGRVFVVDHHQRFVVQGSVVKLSDGACDPIQASGGGSPNARSYKLAHDVSGVTTANVTGASCSAGTAKRCGGAQAGSGSMPTTRDALGGIGATHSEFRSALRLLLVAGPHAALGAEYDGLAPKVRGA